MSDIDITVKFKEYFFDAPKVEKAVDKGNRSALSKAGAFVRTRARSLLNKRSKNSSAPNQAPRRHVGLLRKLLFFGYDTSTKTMLVGPARFKNSEAPHVLEFGGDEVITIHVDGKPKKVKAHYRARPYMGPALKETESKLPEQWRNCIRG
jgi:hypothetical protein